MSEQPTNGNPSPAPVDPIGLGHWVTWFIGVYLFLASSLLGFAFLKLWPHVVADTPETRQALGELTLFTLPVPRSLQLLVLAMVMGGLGTFLHVAGSFVVYVGNRELVKSWVWWYLLWPYIGMVLAVVLYVTFRAGFVSIAQDQDAVNPYGVAAISALAGMFARHAIEKLREVFATLFQVRDPTVTMDKAGATQRNPIPVLNLLEPGTVAVGPSPLPIKITGQGFVPTSEVRVAGIARRSDFVSPTELRLYLSASDVGAAGTLEVTVFNPPPGGGTSAPAKIPVWR